jgi:farnesyl-diphosphate farnesyltransferase
MDEQRVLTELLRQTSRSFHLTLRVLPGAVRWPIGLAYLLARISDTVADTTIVLPEQRLAALEEFRQRILGARAEPMNLAALVQHQGSPAERALLENGELAIAALAQLAPADRDRVTEVLRVILSGQESDLRRFAGADANRVVALATAAELDDYTYRVAGCVGEFWTRMCRAHLFPRARLDETQFLADAVAFGKGLQLVNILRDLPADLRQGRCYLPADELARSGLAPTDLLAPASEPRLRPLYNALLDQARAQLNVGWRYTNNVPRSQIRVRLACAWPILIGAATLAKLRTEPILDLQHRVKISRADVRRIVWRSLVAYPFERAWERQFTSTNSTGKAVA